MQLDVFVQNVKYYCELKGVKPTVACDESGAGKNLLGKLANHGSIPSVERVQLLAEYLGCTVSDLLGEERKGSPPSEEDELRRLYASLTAQNREKAKDYLALLLSAQDKP